MLMVIRRKEVTFCSMVHYNSSRSYHGTNFAHVDKEAKNAFALGAAELPNQRYVQCIYRKYYLHC